MKVLIKLSKIIGEINMICHVINPIKNLSAIVFSLIVIFNFLNIAFVEYSSESDETEKKTMVIIAENIEHNRF